MNGCTAQRCAVVASCASPASVFLPCRFARLYTRSRCNGKHVASVAQLGQVQTEVLTSTRQAGQIGRLPRQEAHCRSLEEEPALPLYASLDGDILTPANKFAYYEALRSGLKALRAVGINGICVDVYWGIVEGVRPREYDWSSYKQLFTLIQNEGFMVQLCLCFHGSGAVPLPSWLVEAGRSNPDMYYTDRSGVRCTDYVSLGANEVPVLAGRTPLECYRDFMASLRRELGPLLGSTILDVVVGLGPDGELKYPAHPLRDKRWVFPGVGEFQCYDKYMLACLRACAQQVDQPSWGLRGPHDAGSYTVWPHQTGFFHQRGNWGSPYGNFFLQWYGDMLLQHADAVLGIAKQELLAPGPPAAAVPAAALNFGGMSYYGYGGDGGGGFDSQYCDIGGTTASMDDDVGLLMAMAAAVAGRPSSPPPPAIRLHARLPNLHWWYGTASHAPELTAGYYNTATRDGYLPAMHVLARHGVGVRLRGGELRNRDMHPQACCDPERQLAQQRTVAAALRVPVGLENCCERFDAAALNRLEEALFDRAVYLGIELPQVQSLVFNRMCDSMFEPGNWTRFKDFVKRVRSRAETLLRPQGSRCGGGRGGVAAAAQGAPPWMAGAGDGSGNVNANVSGTLQLL